MLQQEDRIPFLPESHHIAVPREFVIRGFIGKVWWDALIVMQFCKITCFKLDEANGRHLGFCIWSGKQIDMIQLTFLIYLGLLLSGLKSFFLEVASESFL
jgi:hypothetical protein